LSYLLDVQGLLNAIETYPYNWVLIPGPAKMVRLFHHSCFTTGGKLIVLKGIMVYGITDFGETGT
jgi:hypothetical protein